MAKRAVFGIVTSQSQAERLVQQLTQIGVSPQDISVLLPDKQATRTFAHEKKTKAPEGAVAGAGALGLVGGAIGLLAGIGSIAIPGLGVFMAAGPLLGALSAAAVGAGLGGVTGALIGMGIPELEAKQYEGKLRGGNILISVHTEDSKQVDQVKELFKANLVESISSSTEASVPKSREAGAMRRAAEAEMPPHLSPPASRMSPPSPSAPHK